MNYQQISTTVKLKGKEVKKSMRYAPEPLPLNKISEQKKDWVNWPKSIFYWEVVIQNICRYGFG